MRLQAEDAGTAMTSEIATSEIERAVARSLAAWSSGERMPFDLAALASRAAGARIAAAVVQVQALRALFAMEAGDHAGGLAFARRASLMARTEAIAEAEWLASLALARARRHNRQSHLAVRILEAVDQAVSPGWRPWLDWERLLAGAALPDGRVATSGPTATLCDLLAAAKAGDRGAFARHASALCADTTSAPFRREAAVLVEALDPYDNGGPVGGVHRDGDGEPLRAWRRGEAPLPPALLHGLLLPPSSPRRAEPPPGEHGACVILWPDGRSARFLAAGLPLLDRAGVARLPPARRQHGRVETLLAILALAGPAGLDEATCFSRAYGFNYVPGLHRGVFDVLVHRGRGAVDGLATLARERGRLVLETTQPLLLFDPRASRSTTDRVLRLLAEQGRASAKEAAERLGLSLRAAQGALSELAGNHACVVERDGRNVTYAVEDSVFSEPTGRLLGQGEAIRAEGFGAAGA